MVKIVLESIIGGAAGGATVSIVIRAVDKFSAAFAGINKKLLGIGVATTALGIVGVAALSKLGKAAITEAARFEQTSIAFETMLGSAEAGQKKLKELTDFAVRTPFTLPGIEDSARQLLAMGISSDDLLPTLKSLGDLSAGLSVPLSRLALNFGQVKTQAKLTGRELKDFNVLGVPLVAQLAEQLGVTEKAIFEMTSRGEIGFDAVNEAFKRMTSDGGRFANLMEAQMESLNGQVSNLKDNLTVLARELGQELLPIAKTVVKWLNNMTEAIKDMDPALRLAMVGLFGFASIAAFIVGPLLILSVVIPAITAGATTLGAVLLATGIAAAIIGVAIFDIIIIMKKWKTITADFALFWAKIWANAQQNWIIFKTNFLNAFDTIIGAWKIGWLGIKLAFGTVWNFIIDSVEKGVNFILNKVATMVEALAQLVKKISPGFAERLFGATAALRAGVSLGGVRFDTGAISSEIAASKLATSVSIANRSRLASNEINKIQLELFETQRQIVDAWNESQKAVSEQTKSVEEGTKAQAIATQEVEKFGSFTDAIMARTGLTPQQFELIKKRGGSVLASGQGQEGQIQIQIENLNARNPEEFIETVDLLLRREVAQ